MTVPIVGAEPFVRVMTSHVQVIICNCNDYKPIKLLMMMGVGNPVICDACGRRYHLRGMLDKDRADIVCETPIQVINPDPNQRRM
jgi:hypothetical protein